MKRLLVLLALLVLSAAPPALASAWVWPLAGPHAVTRPFAPGPTPYSPGHRGADLPGTPGQPVLAAGAGRVSYAGLLAGRGVVVVVHGVLRTTYEPVTATVGVGALVSAGQQIGVLEPGHDGCPVAACLHWGLLRGDVYLDPVALVDPGPVRLLPRPVGAVVGEGTPPAARQVEPARGAASGAVEPAAARSDEPAGSPGHTAALAGTVLAAGLVGMGALRRSRARL